MENVYNVPMPQPTEEGAVLTVKNGTWQLGSGGGGASGLVVNVVDVTLDKTYSDIKTAIESGIFPVVLKGDGDGGYEVYAIKTFSEGGGEYYVELPFALYVANSATGVLTEEE